MLLLDGPHLFATVSRTYLDARERKTRARLLWGSLGWFAAGPAMFAASVLAGQRWPFAVFVTLTSLVFWPSVSRRMDFLMFTVAVTAFHNVQYHGIVWFFHRNRYHAEGVDRSAFGWAPKVSQRFIVYALCGLAFTLAYRTLGCGMGVHPGCGAFDAKMALGGAGLTLRDLMEGFIWGFALHHYFLDQYLWRVRRDAGLNQDLKLGWRALREAIEVRFNHLPNASS